MIIIIALTFLMLLVGVTIRKNNENQSSILLRILTNYIQLVGVALSFNIRYPITINNLMIPLQRIGSMTENLLSFD